jgi:hypothetical protein
VRAYDWSVRLKLGLIVFAVVIAVASLAYTGSLVERLREREQAIIRLWADAQAEVARAQFRTGNPHRADFRALQTLVTRLEADGPGERAGGGGGGPALAPDEARAYRRALAWAESMPPAAEFDFITNEIIIPNAFGIPAIITDTTGPLFWRNVGVPDTLASLSRGDSLRAVARLDRLVTSMDETYTPLPIRIDARLPGGSTAQIRQRVHYDESALITELRVYPYVQLLFVGLFVAVGYLGFSYVRRSEQSSLWVGMAREAAHQLGTPISSLMGWVEFLRLDGLAPAQRAEAVDEIENDVQRLRRVADRFSDIGSMPKLERRPLAPIVEQTADYMRRRMPSRGQHVTLEVDVAGDLAAPLNEELFAWVVENLLKNALDAINGAQGRIRVRGYRDAGAVGVEVADTGCGIERRQWANVFRPGYSTKKRGWGLGLSLARRVVEDYHGGTLRLVDSTVGEGTTFRVELPARAESEGD